MVTPLFIVFVAIGGTDILFALDSIPAVFGVTSQAYIVFAASAFALLGLRALSFLVTGLLDSPETAWHWEVKHRLAQWVEESAGANAQVEAWKTDGRRRSDVEVTFADGSRLGIRSRQGPDGTRLRSGPPQLASRPHH